MFPSLARSVFLTIGALAFSAFPAPAFAVESIDLGDAPASYDLGSAGPARASATGPRLGRTVTVDRIDPQTQVSVTASETADGDQGDDGLAEAPVLTDGRFAVTATVSRVSDTARLCGWLDANRDGTFDPAERSCTDVAGSAGSAELTWSARSWRSGSTYLRLRVASDAHAEQPTGSSDGEIEDYRARVGAPSRRDAISLTKTVTPDQVDQPGARLDYRFAATNTGTTELSNVQISDEMPGLSAVECTPAAPATLAPGATMICSADRVVSQDDIDFGSIPNLAAVAGEAPGGDPDDETDDVIAIADATVHVDQRARMTVAASSTGRKARRGDRVPVKLTVTNTGNVTLSNLTFSANLRGVRCERVALAAGEQLECTARYTVTKADTRKNRAVIAVVGRSEQPYGLPTSSSDDIIGRATVRIPVVRSTSASQAPAPSGHRAGLADTGGSSLVGLAAGFGLTMTGGIVLAGQRFRRIRR